MSKNCLSQQQKTRNNQGSATVIKIKRESEAKKLFLSDLRLRGIIKMVKKYLEAQLSSLSATYFGIGNE